MTTRGHDIVVAADEVAAIASNAREVLEWASSGGKPLPGRVEDAEDAAWHASVIEHRAFRLQASELSRADIAARTTEQRALDVEEREGVAVAGAALQVTLADGSTAKVVIGFAGDGALVPGWVTWHIDGRELDADPVAHLTVTRALGRIRDMLWPVLYRP